MGYSCAQATNWTTSFVTIGLAVDFIGTAEVGQWLAIETEVDQDRPHDLLCAEPDQGRRRRDGARRWIVPCGAESTVATEQA